MRVAGLVGASRRRGGPITTQRDKQARPAPDLVERDFQAAGPNQLWVADITCVPTAAGFLYRAVVVDVWSRKSLPRKAGVVGWARANHLRAELVLDALNMALGQRRPRSIFAVNAAATTEGHQAVGVHPQGGHAARAQGGEPHAFVAADRLHGDQGGGRQDAMAAALLAIRTLSPAQHRSSHSFDTSTPTTGLSVIPASQPSHRLVGTPDCTMRANALSIVRVSDRDAGGSEVPTVAGPIQPQLWIR